MAFKLVLLVASLAYANAGLIAAPAAVATYSAAPAVSHSYIQQSSAAPLAYAAHVAPVATPIATYAHTAPIAATYAHAAPIATTYAAHAAPLAYHTPAISATHQNVIRSFGGNQAVSTYSKSEDTAFSSVRKFDQRVTNDALTAYHTPAFATYAHAAPVATTYAAHAAPLAYSTGPVVKTATIGYSPAAVVSHATFNGLGVNYGW